MKHYAWSGECNEEGIARLTTDPEPEQVYKPNEKRKFVLKNSSIIIGEFFLGKERKWINYIYQQSITKIFF